MRVQTEEWQRFIPGVRMYKGKKTLFYNGEELWEESDDDTDQPLVYDYEERDTWEVIIVLPGVEVIPDWTFWSCKNIETVIMPDSVKRIEWSAFDDCKSLEFVRLSQNLEFIGTWAFKYCQSLSSIFIPPSCGKIDDWAFSCCKCLVIVGMSQHTQVGMGVFQNTSLLEASPFDLDEDGDYDYDDDDAVIQWIKSNNDGEAYALHRACSSFNPLSEIIHALVKRYGVRAMKMKNAIGITPSQYLAANMFTDISEKEIINRYILDMMGEVI
ncbi:leucine-rich repeat domain-containing protein [Chaetoceros tenuissimus]|uniref:Leucine-rich repeat domain-containing protein n=1 Tax=Chaetoceros tenuissimus TaxID=426638 RepID=A0AAD3CJP4_9STRA|nr:leucine-rich repeat domain-containing protein [Chaetoceros tenuissimus]